ncbi:nickel-dependent lactate racemase [Dethiobacter alkaliphilus]|uniref:nickel-dependent lactate racemase n=1 Tax=Dethiobacter alkaliphilus TaxID=427926 RepID=UPI002227773B|nr:nickel-dependent lactate racemase [Dethiobacter alkaliphilus]MCW3490067.1 nickel-dependent lactate racemase [Dethiobacter alkaliphilus]
MVKKIKLAYGKTEFSLALEPERLLAVLLPGELPSPQDEAALVRKAMANPVGTPRLQEIVRDGETACIIVGDMTRLWVRHHVLLPLILDELNRGGIADENITLVSATGAHREQTKEEHLQLIGAEAYRRVRVVDHKCRDEDLVDYGPTTYGTPVRINRHVANADRVILTGGIVYHFLAGYGGGKKALMPGVADYAGIMANHRLALNPDGPGLNRDVCAGKMTGNPLSDDMLQAVEKVGIDFIVNTIINDEHQIALAVAGDVVEAHEAGCSLVDKYFGVPIKEQADLVIASCGGYPKDINFYQTYKTTHNMVPALKKGGVGILLSESCEGVGNDLFYTICTDHSDNVAREDALRSDFEIASFMGYTQLLWAQQNRFIAVTGMPHQQVRNMGMTPATSLEEALSIAKSLLSEDYTAYIMPEGSTTFPILQP